MSNKIHSCRPFVESRLVRAPERPDLDAGLEDDCPLGGAALYAEPDLAVDARRELQTADDGLPGLEGLEVALDGLPPDVGVVERLGDERADRIGLADLLEFRGTSWRVG